MPAAQDRPERLALLRLVHDLASRGDDLASRGDDDAAARAASAAAAISPESPHVSGFGEPPPPPAAPPPSPLDPHHRMASSRGFSGFEAGGGVWRPPEADGPPLSGPDALEMSRQVPCKKVTTWSLGGI